MRLSWWLALTEHRKLLCSVLVLLTHMAVLVKAGDHKFSHIAMDLTKLENTITLSLRRIQCGSLSVTEGDY